MERFLMHDLKAWKDNANRKPLIITLVFQKG